jgi:GNAT superfamily N-acetyltransferase
VNQVQITTIQDPGSLRRFIELPYQLYRHDPYWVPPLRIAQRELFDRAKHPFYQHAEAAFFLAQQDGRAVGRIGAIVDRMTFDEDRIGSFGFFESIDSQPVANALVEAARAWLAARGATRFRGPMNPSTNYECGTLVMGFDAAPLVMMTYNPPYHDALLKGAGLAKAKDLLAFATTPTSVTSDKVHRVAERAMRSNGLTIRPINLKRFDQEVDAIWRIYNDAWQRNWGFARVSEAEFRLMAKEMKQILVPDFVLVGEVKGRPVGFTLTLPDMNIALKSAKGNLFPLGLIKILYHQRRIKDYRVLALGVVEQYRTAGVAACFYSTLIRESVRLRCGLFEFSWVLEDNVLMNRASQAMGAEHYKTYRIYEGMIHHA